MLRVTPVSYVNVSRRRDDSSYGKKLYSIPGAEAFADEARDRYSETAIAPAVLEFVEQLNRVRR